MLKRSSSRMKKVLAILLVVLFVVSLTAVAVNAAKIKDHSKSDSKNVDSKDSKSVDSKDSKSVDSKPPIGLGWDGLDTDDGTEDAIPCHWVFNGFSWQYTCSPYSAYPYI
jgi:hypothetical protein